MYWMRHGLHFASGPMCVLLLHAVETNRAVQSLGWRAAGTWTLAIVATSIYR